MWERPRRSGTRRLVTVSEPLSRKPWPSWKPQPALSPARWPRRAASFCSCPARQRQLPPWFTSSLTTPACVPGVPSGASLPPVLPPPAQLAHCCRMNHPPAVHMPLAFLPLRLLLPFPEPGTPSPPPALAVEHIQCLFGTYCVWGSLPASVCEDPQIRSQAPCPQQAFSLIDERRRVFLAPPSRKPQAASGGG